MSYWLETFALMIVWYACGIFVVIVADWVFTWMLGPAFGKDPVGRPCPICGKFHPAWMEDWR
jgi:hypothetical protein